VRGTKGFGDLQRPANFLYWVFLLMEILGNTQLLAGEGFWPAAFFPSSTGCLLNPMPRSSRLVIVAMSGRGDRLFKGETQERGKG
jgi:hypothetical protein